MDWFVPRQSLSTRTEIDRDQSVAATLNHRNANNISTNISLRRHLRIYGLGTHAATHARIAPEKLLDFAAGSRQEPREHRHNVQYSTKITIDEVVWKLEICKRKTNASLLRPHPPRSNRMKRTVIRHIARSFQFNAFDCEASNVSLVSLRRTRTRLSRVKNC